MNDRWTDAVIGGVENTKNLLDYMLKERSQLYGTIIFLLIRSDITEAELPPEQVFKNYGNDYYVVYERAAEDGLFRVRLKEREDSSD